MNNIHFATAFSAGLATFFSPCVLPLIPGYLSLMSGISAKELLETRDRRSATALKAGLLSLSFVAGFSLAFSVLGAAASAFSAAIFKHRLLAAKISGGALIILGLHLTGILSLKWLYYERRVSMGGFKPGHIGAFLMGLAFAIGWSPCIGPVLAGILAIAANSSTSSQGFWLLLAYSAGLGLPFIAAGFATAGFMKTISKYKRFLKYSEICAGGILIIVGILIIQNRVLAAGRFF